MNQPSRRPLHLGEVAAPLILIGVIGTGALAALVAWTAATAAAGDGDAFGVPPLGTPMLHALLAASAPPRWTPSSGPPAPGAAA